MTISKEELAEVRRAVEGNLSEGEYDAIADWAMPKLLSDLDAANAHIAQLEARATIHANIMNESATLRKELRKVFSDSGLLKFPLSCLPTERGMTIFDADYAFTAHCAWADDASVLTAAVNAAPKLLDSLDSLEKRIAELEAQNATLREELGLRSEGDIYSCEYCERLYGGDSGRYCEECNQRIKLENTIDIQKSRIDALEDAAKYWPSAPMEDIEKLCELSRSWGTWSALVRRYKNGSKNHTKALDMLEDLDRQAYKLRDKIRMPDKSDKLARAHQQILDLKSRIYELQSCSYP